MNKYDRKIHMVVPSLNPESVGTNIKAKRAMFLSRLIERVVVMLDMHGTIAIPVYYTGL